MDGRQDGQGRIGRQSRQGRQDGQGRQGVQGRHELKYHINYADYMQLKAILSVIAKPDENAVEGGGYKIRSLYFDNYEDKAVVDKLSGQSAREKFRLRYYNDDISFIRLEKKSKSDRFTYKESVIVSQECCSAILTGNYDYLKALGSQLGGKHEAFGEKLYMELYAKIGYQNLRPRTIVDYRREAYTYRAGNVRITFDSNIRSSNNAAGFLQPKSVTIPSAAGTIILEIKYDGFLPDLFQSIIKLPSRSQTEFSKYVAARLVN